MARMRRLLGLLSVLGVAALASGGCNSLLDIAESPLVQQPDASTSSCLLDSDCQSTQVCLFKICSQPCNADRDCGRNARCLKTTTSAACLEASSGACDALGNSCPAGTQCADGKCRTLCTGNEAVCLKDQICASDGVCRGTDAAHDPLAQGSSGGAGGASGGGGAGDGATGGDSTFGGASGAAGAGGTGIPPRECETSAARCNELGERETCTSEGKWGSPVKCPFVCANNDCAGECIPNSKDCVKGTTPRICNEQGKWTELQACPAVCLDGKCEASCETGEKQCSGKDVLVCSADGNFEKNKTCPYLCDATSKDCTGECVPTTQRCSGTKLQSCGADALWQTLATCPAVCTAKVGAPGQFECTGECSPTTRRCDTSSTLQVCNDSGHYVNTDCAASNKTCYSVSSVPGCNGSCAPGQKQCSSNKVQSCNSTGSFADSQTCTNQTCVASNGVVSCVGSCAPGQQQCVNNRVQNCNSSGSFADAVNCTTTNKTCIESGTTASCLGSCAPGQTTCIDNNAQGCDSTGKFVLTDDCTPPDEICSSGACVANNQYTVGNASASGYSNFDVPNDQWYVVKIVPPTTANVIAIRLIGRSTNGIMRMALWKDSNGAPGAFVAQTDNTNMAAGVVSDAPVPLATKVTGGQAYWVGAKFTNSAQIYQKSETGLTGYIYDHSFGTNPALLNPFPAASAGTFSNVALNFYLLVQNESL